MSNRTPEVSRLEILPVRQAFAHEAYDFTKWLENHIDVLSERLGLQLSVTGREKRVGDFIIDLVCEDEEGQQVVIENQLERTNHSHLGQILTYMIGMEAQIAIWISTEARPEHQKVIEWLNESSSSEVGFYLVKVEAVRIGDSPYAPLFSVLAAPTNQAKELGEQKKEWASRHQNRQEFWAGLLEKSKGKTKLFSNTSPGKYHWIGVGAGISGIKYTYVIGNDSASVDFYIDTDKNSGEQNKRIFDLLLRDKEKIETMFGGSLEWDRLDSKRASRIRKTISSSGLAQVERWSELQDQMLDSMIRLEKAIKPFLNGLDAN
ncbi:MAG: DUF4268 domain-containing protein [Bdellovibrio sp.]|nr:DUF4268 domain-containing protein [Bdellovibrio sp.]